MEWAADIEKHPHSIFNPLAIADIAAIMKTKFSAATIRAALFEKEFAMLRDSFSSRSRL